MANPDWARLKTLFQQALDVEPAERGRWLAEKTPNDATLRREVERLLHAHDSAGGFLEEPPELEPVRHIGPYEIDREVGRGGMGIVYVARDARLNRRVALKALPAPLTADPAQRERLRREARAAARLTHPGIATVYSLEEANGELFIVSEYVAGPTLRERLAGGALGVDRALALTAQLLDALSAAHAAGIVHRDLKPENVILGNAGQIKIVDFGIALLDQADATRLTRAGAALGTPAYMAPEQVAGLGSDARSDLYAVGIMLAEMATGTHPLSAEASPLPPAIAPIVSRALAAEPRNRYQTAAELLHALRATDGPPSNAAKRWWEFHQVAAVVVYAAMMAPAWSARGVVGGRPGQLLFAVALAGTVLSAVLRLHRLFTSRWYPAELAHVRERTNRTVHVADGLITAAFIGGGVLVTDTSEALSVLLFAMGLGIGVAFLAIEPATARAAFGGTHHGHA